ncbi:MAG: bifunctional homocysteine S-methyltransferase/methylenetetrahydrofolate reductase [Eubacteriales bacterium]|nr:bifunctional homocysteine S-methyltransferase/methylenetetrahydrofolate reductase [Eubacteriales bacterium]
MEKSIQLNKYLENNKLLCDGAFGTYYASIYETDSLPEYANLEAPERVKRIHEEYLAAGAQLIRTNTFACNSMVFENEAKLKASIRQAFQIAKEAAGRYSTKDEPRYVAADIGPAACNNIMQKGRIQEEYKIIAKEFLNQGADIFVFETFASFDDILPAIEMIGSQAFIIVQFAVNQFGYSIAGLSAGKLLSEAHKCDYVDAAGLNCGVGPGHMHQLINRAAFSDKYISVFPNAGYPQIISNRMIFSDKNIDYFVKKTMEIASEGVNIIGGCCGTTPAYIKKMSQLIHGLYCKSRQVDNTAMQKENKKEDKSFFRNKKGRKLIAVELAPPVGSDDKILMDAAHLLKACDVDVVTFPDSPSGRTRADSVLMAEKVMLETGLCVMPHICCRDKNAIAMRSQLLGAYINKINNFLVVTGDPIPSVMRNSVEGVFNFDSVGLMNIINDMNQDVFTDASMTYGGAVNQGRRNFSVEINRVKKKIQAGASFFMSQPVFSDEDIERLKQLKKETGAIILYGIMPFVSLRNALFMKNEMTGINVTDEVLNRYRPDMTKEEGEKTGVLLAVDLINKTKDIADGYYFSFPFNRVHMLKAVMDILDWNNSD